MDGSRPSLEIEGQPVLALVIGGKVQAFLHPAGREHLHVALRGGEGFPGAARGVRIPRLEK